MNALMDVMRLRAKGEIDGPLRASVADRIGQKDVGKWFPDGLRLKPSESNLDAPERPPNKDER